MENNSKKIVSNVLKDPREWVSFIDKMPPDNVPIVIRLCHKKTIINETATEKYPLEDVKIGVCNDHKISILPPFPKYDYSPLSNNDSINEDVDITHWAVASDEEIDWWITRFNRINKYSILELKVDKEQEKSLYEALSYGAMLLNMDPKKKELSSYLYDLQNCIDFDNSENKITRETLLLESNESCE